MHRIFRSSGLGFIIKIAGTGASFLTYAILMRAIGSEATGQYLVVTSTCIVFAAIARFGLDNLITRETATTQDPGAKGQLLNEAHRASRAPNIAATAIYIFIGSMLLTTKIISAEFFFAILLSSPSIFLFSAFTINYQFILGTNNPILSTFLSVFLCQALITTTSIPLSISYGLNGAIAAYSISNALALLASQVTTKTYRQQASNCQSKPEFNIRERLNLMSATLSDTVINMGTPALLSLTLQPQSIAHFGIAQKVASILNFIFTSINTTITPHIPNARNPQKLRELYESANKLMILCGLPAIAILLAFGRDILKIFNSNATQDYSSYTTICLAYFIILIGGPSASFIIMKKNTEKYREIQILTLLIYICALLIGAYTYGNQGAAIGLFTSLAIQRFLTHREARRLFESP